MAERDIVFALLSAAVRASGIEVSAADLDECASQVTKNENTRFFHVVRALTLESAIAGSESAKPCLVPEEEMSRAGIGLAYSIMEDPPEKITNVAEARSFLDRVVAEIQAKVSSRLKELWILPVVSYSFTQLDELSRDGTRWSLSTRSLLSLEDGADWLHVRLETENWRRSLAEIANRAIIETAVYSFNPDATEIISQTEHASLLAQFAVMIQLANYRDAVVNGLVEVDITVHSNGSIQYEDRFYERVLQPYLKSRLDDKIQWDSDYYEKNFDDSDSTFDPSVAENPEVISFQKAFAAEFGFPYETLIKLVRYFDELTIARDNTWGTMSLPAFQKALKDKIGLSEAQTEVFLARFVLPIRPVWNKNLPKGCDHNDVLPWRFYRGLSVLVRPIVEVERSPKHYVISASHLHRWRQYLTDCIFRGHLPERLFQSAEMRSYLGRVAHKKGHEFAKEVGEVVAKVFQNVRLEIKMTEIGAPESPDLGDIDVLAWNANTGVVLLVECKRLKTALTVRQVIQQLEQFRGDAANPDDSLAKHQRRIEWLRANPVAVSRISGVSPEQIRWTPLLVTSERVPMSYIDATDFSKDQVIPFQELDEYVSQYR